MNTLEVSKIEDVYLGISAGAQRSKAEALEIASVIERVESQAQLEMATDALRVLEDLSRGVEKSRKLVKEPVLNLGERIDSMASEYVAAVDKESARIKGLVAAYTRKIVEAQRVAEAARLKREHELLLEKSKATAEANRASGEARNQADKRVVEIRKEIATLPAVVAPPKPQGLQAKPVWVATVTDAVKAYAARPDFFDLTPKLRVINDALAAGMRECPGLSIREEMKVGVR